MDGLVFQLYHAHPGSPYVFGLIEDDRDLEFPEPMPVVGISRSAKGYCMVSVLETITEEALGLLVGEFGEGGLLWAECNGRHFEWIEGDMLDEILFRVKGLYGLDDKVTFRNVTVASENRPHPLHLGTASQIGAIQTEGIPFLLKILLRSNCTGLPAMYVRDLLLNPPAYAIASIIQDICKLMSNVSCTIPEFTCITPSKRGREIVTGGGEGDGEQNEERRGVEWSRPPPSDGSSSGNRRWWFCEQKASTAVGVLREDPGGNNGV
ncbi:hypothetical protein L1987_45855 [Smallanthus sonchifolius]|uniref:Uncharacterized protein n=1 Tax=Smallanthus sonchifolius TaxID=185202 RepID=A0ACB9FY00_9ASTR|nr:hypothetical protein L1987_45855 [Smallanthus sonchifolius]